MAFEVRSGEGLVVLDLEADEYSCAYEPERLIPAYRAIASIDDASDRPLAGNEWIQPCSRPEAQVSLRDIKRFAQALIQSSLRFRRRSVQELADIAQRLRVEPCAHGPDIRDVADRFQALWLWLPWRPKCLLGSFFLLHFMARYGFRADWIFGVQLFPFRAHCWIATENELLNEVPHAIEDYHIIWVSAPAPQ
jgi:hypothetical protein